MDPVALAALGTVLVLGLGGAYVRSARFWRRETYDALSSERWRIACDLHDGLAQHLACIAAQGQRLDCHLDPDHPLMLASRQALVSVRDVIMDLMASAAPTTEAALGVIADQLGRCLDLEVDVHIEAGSRLSLDARRDPAERDDLIRTAREAIVNAARHPGPRHVDLVLSRDGDLLVRAADGRRITARTEPVPT
jgi:signal transduction histidine kinase